MKAELVTNLKRNATRILAELRETGDPVLITEHGKPAAFLVDVKQFEAMKTRMDLLEGIARGERDIAEGRVITHDEFKVRFAKWLT
jgi:prevent-host-death family protein